MKNTFRGAMIGFFNYKRNRVDAYRIVARCYGVIVKEKGSLADAYGVIATNKLNLADAYGAVVL